MSEIQGVGNSFKVKEYLKVREMTQDILNSLLECVKPGLKESEVLNLMKDKLKLPPIDKNWHPLKFRVDHNTTLSFSDISPYDPILTEDSLYFIDIGPVINGYEGDFGDTFYLGNNSEKLFLKNAARKVFDYTSNIWKKEKLSGQKLYQKASDYAKELGLLLNDRMDGHRLGDFPHQVFYKGGLAEIDQTPIENLWVLEIQVIDPRLKMGAFFEDILKI